MQESFRDTLTRLGDAQKRRARGAPAYSVYVNRKIGRVLAAFAYRRGWSPNQVTAVSAVFTFTGVALVALVSPSVLLGVGIWLLLALGYAWDSADGQVARLGSGGSMSGEWLDHVVDGIKASSVHLAVLVGTYRFVKVSPTWLLVPIGFAVVASVTFFAMILNDLLKGARGVPQAAERGGSTRLRSLLVLPMDYGVLCAAFVAWGAPTVFRAVYTGLAAFCTVFLVLAAVKWFREMRSIDAARDQGTSGAEGSEPRVGP